jgi:hypothetical protein
MAAVENDAALYIAIIKKIKELNNIEDIRKKILIDYLIKILGPAKAYVNRNKASANKRRRIDILKQFNAEFDDLVKHIQKIKLPESSMPNPSVYALGNNLTSYTMISNIYHKIQPYVREKLTKYDIEEIWIVIIEEIFIVLKNLGIIISIPNKYFNYNQDWNVRVRKSSLTEGLSVQIQDNDILRHINMLINGLSSESKQELYNQLSKLYLQIKQADPKNTGKIDKRENVLKIIKESIDNPIASGSAPVNVKPVAAMPQSQRARVPGAAAAAGLRLANTLRQQVYAIGGFHKQSRRKRRTHRKRRTQKK